MISYAPNPKLSRFEYVQINNNEPQGTAPDTSALVTCGSIYRCCYTSLGPATVSPCLQPRDPAYGGGVHGPEP